MEIKFLFNESNDTKTFQPGDIIIRQGDKAYVMYSLIEGEVEVFINGQLINTLKPGDIFGEMALIKKDRRHATIIAKTQCKLNTISRERFLSLVQEDPYFALDFMSLLLDRMSSLN
jgi:CRP-like cAMP-binding protein